MSLQLHLLHLLQLPLPFLLLLFALQPLFEGLLWITGVPLRRPEKTIIFLIYLITLINITAALKHNCILCFQRPGQKLWDQKHLYSIFTHLPQDKILIPAQNFSKTKLITSIQSQLHLNNSLFKLQSTNFALTFSTFSKLLINVPLLDSIPITFFQCSMTVGRLCALKSILYLLYCIKTDDSMKIRH